MNQTDLNLFGIGQTLREAREAKELSLSDIASLLRIREAHLAALEADDYDSLPGKVYAIGFIRTYGNYLGLDASELIDRYKGMSPDRVIEEPIYDVADEDEAMSPALKITAGVVLVLVVYLAWLFAGTPSEGIAVTQPAPQVVEATEDEAPAVAAEGQDNLLPETLIVAEEAPEGRTDPVEAAPIAVPEQVEPIAEAEIAVASETAAGAAVAQGAPSVSNDVIQIRAKRRTWMRIENSEGKVLFSSIIKKDDSFELDTSKTYFLATRDAGALEFVINDIAGSSVGRRGQILTKRRLDRDSIIASQP